MSNILSISLDSILYYHSQSFTYIHADEMLIKHEFGYFVKSIWSIRLKIWRLRLEV